VMLIMATDLEARVSRTVLLRANRRPERSRRTTPRASLKIHGPRARLNFMRADDYSDFAALPISE
jgi:hypothetical protein